MDYIESKLKVFRDAVIGDAEQQRNNILEDIQKKKAQMVEKRENELLEWAYKTIQKEKNSIEKLNNERISKAVNESKCTLIQKREEIVACIFDRLSSRIEEYRLTNEYIDHLCISIKAGMDQVGEGELVVYIDKRDEKYIEEIEKRIGAKVECDTRNIIGGSRILNKTRSIIADNSLIESINECRENFLEDVGLSINVDIEGV